MNRLFLLPMLGGLGAALALPAQALTIAPTDRGNVSRFASPSPGGTPVIRHNPDDTNVSAAELTLLGPVTTRGYAWFAIPAGLDEVASVTLKVYVAPLGSSPVSFSLVSIEHPYADFQVGYAEVPTPEGEALLQDLGGGDTYLAPVTVPAGGALPDGSFVLSASAVAAVNAARGGLFGIGFTGGGSLARIEFLSPVLEVTPVPEPAGWALGGLGAALLGWRGKKRRA